MEKESRLIAPHSLYFIETPMLSAFNGRTLEKSQNYDILKIN